MVERGGPGHHVRGADAAQGQAGVRRGEAGQPHREQQHQQGPGAQGGVKGVLSDAAAQALHHHCGKQPADDGDIIGHAGGQGHGQQQPGDQGGAVGQGDAAVREQAQQPLTRQGGQDGHRRHRRRPEAVDEEPRRQRGKQGDHHIQHQPGDGVLPPDVGGRADSQIHFAPSFSARLPLRMPVTRGTLPGQV